MSGIISNNQEGMKEGKKKETSLIVSEAPDLAEPKKAAKGNQIT